jgi:hypothetical protein
MKQPNAAARSSTGEHSADNRKAEVQLLPGRLDLRHFLFGTKVLAAAHLALNQAGEGSSPSGPIAGSHWWSSRQDSALVRRKRGFEPHPVLLGSLAIRRRNKVPMM